MMQNPDFNISATEILSRLQTAASNLLWMSESEYPFAAFMWQIKAELLETQLLLQQTHHPPETSVTAIDIDTFFKPAATPQPWHNLEEAAIVQQYQNLAAILKQCLRHLRVYKIGQGTLDIYIIGVTPDGNLAGVTTKAVET